MAEDPATTVELPQHVLDYLSDHKTLTLATASASGLPRAATLLYVSKGPVLYLWVKPHSTTAKHIEQNPFVSFTIDEYSEDWRQTRGIQGNAECEVVLDGEEIARAAMLFGQKFPDLPTGSSTVGIYFLRVRPTQIELIDNTKGDERRSAEQFGVEFRRDAVLDILSELPDEVQPSVALGAQLQRMQAEPGEVIVRQGGPAQKFFIIVDGEVEVLREDDGMEHQVATLGPGSFFGEHAILRDTPRTATVRALKPTTLLAMEHDSFRTLVAASLGTTANFDQVIQQRLERPLL